MGLSKASNEAFTGFRNDRSFLDKEAVNVMDFLFLAGSARSKYGLSETDGMLYVVSRLLENTTKRKPH